MNLPLFVNPRNVRFTLLEALKAQDLQRYSYFADFDESAYEMSLDAAMQIAQTELFPYYREMDKKKAVCENGVVTTHPQLKNIIRAIAEGGWISAGASHEWGGLQMPSVLLHAGLFHFYAANVNACYPFLTQGAANLILSFGSQALKTDYIAPMFSGEWQGTMALTEPQAGSSLSDVITSATPTDREGVYQISGQKIYISGGDHDAVTNVVHLLLARIKGAPAGVKGISLFVVPKFRKDASGNFTEKNDVITAGIYGKMGQKGYIAAHLMYGEQGDCEGYLVGEPHKGLMYMFQMMNEARIGTGLVAAGAASAAYYASLKYANERSQGRHPSNKDLTVPPVGIIEHADVKRMLLFQKCVAEGSFMLLMQSSYYDDIAHASEDPTEKENAHLLLELLTPIAKSYPAEMAIHATSTGMQVLGGAGYCDDFPLELIYRDVRINAIYEGTTTIHGMDILGRKVMTKNGKALQLLGEEITKTIKGTTFKKWAMSLGETAQSVQKTTLALMQLGQEKGAETMLADATLYLEYVGLATMAWLWLKQANAAQSALNVQGESINDQDRQFYQSKILTAQYFFEYELPKFQALEVRLLNTDKFTWTMDGRDLLV